MAVLAMASPVLAALPNKPANRPQDMATLYIAYLVAGVLIVAVCAASFMSSKRTHLD
jgi:hypothetical protein